MENISKGRVQEFHEERIMEVCKEGGSSKEGQKGHWMMLGIQEEMRKR